MSRLAQCENGPSGVRETVVKEQGSKSGSVENGSMAYASSSKNLPKQQYQDVGNTTLTRIQTRLKRHVKRQAKQHNEDG